MNKTSDQYFMQRAFDLAEKGRGSVSPNPMVGCVIVHEGRVVGEGWHQKYGEGHAEVNAVHSVEDTSLLSEATVYVTLEPCAHHGKTPPCADLLVKHKVQRVVIANHDPFPLVNGGGIDKLKAAGIAVEVGMLDHVGRELNCRFFHVVEKQRPYIVLKWAQTADGFVARKNYDSKWISNSYSRKLVHRWRAEEDAILVGKNTVKYDDPTLNVRDWNGTDPLRIFIDRNLELEEGYKIMDRSIPTICYNTVRSTGSENLVYIKLDSRDFLYEMLQDLMRRKVQSVIIEGGSAVLHTFITEKLWDEARVFISQSEFGEGILAPRLIGNQISSLDIEGDKLVCFRPY
ncbi:bifunctional diaminohydroxyphosphoribosylaminopyrimidine deaminase/5-amino-6-(5-phosphoribosylamino)uracil reductase RibD [Gilvimarinus agarilyticus]|uniref:bifunctional diaminohydroxyphosphoribosylaminopyrimidine deaminase/5-amino-6-(5-phosphoribosylamino)uracil reductase RibD n=1 Tax=Reichenbachiella agariperforans TaxID=156994 RepID=UPI001C09E6AD|nr:bifunctional diaminohydroxyphosphoribosylaminopyrimidine deaminase/5-amino-6-(5-phosphoribosylamino)uracil reductase RibD [Reichenbachiella agariperforans]MBU2885565.1 bifunctional diaminohydroxyphosphoribosylaminopyrimidine deaminase/5-amino-6-(5-phosphoribosylamino)uracil reductase RibD [Gilvimarinus agarilyticus]